MSEYQLLRAAVGTGAWLALALFLAASGVVFLSALRHVIDMAYGTPGVPERALPNGRLAVPIVAVAIALLVVLGLWMPLSLSDAIGSAAAVLAG
jgi:formate hydrogenlyase subunit 3/multisubunit Na+/H+ antiporter MnhD subunit